ncbi:MAG: 4Fe-4S binding protein [Eggerthellaceae bacterium]|nr:4Fe-4S binding protein [Eggerthellaceae bacterium]
MKHKIKPVYIRTITMLAIIAIVVVGLATNSANGTLSAMGIGSIALLCPLGALEVMLASKTVIPLAIISLICLVAIGFLIGRIFCGWVCPTPLIRSIFPGKKKGANTKNADSKASGSAGASSGKTVEVQMLSDEERGIPQNATAALASSGSSASCGKCQKSKFHPNKIALPKFDSRFIVLIGALVTTFIFGFPVFCLVCPIGITFGFVIGLWRLFAFNEPTWLLIIFPAMLILELVVFRKWCHKICPVGALMSLASSLNTITRPKVATDKCLRTTKGIACTACKDVCYEEINLHDYINSRPMAECTKCHECSSACPQGAISFLGRRSPVTDTVNVPQAEPDFDAEEMESEEIEAD